MKCICPKQIPDLITEYKSGVIVICLCVDVKRPVKVQSVEGRVAYGEPRVAVQGLNNLSALLINMLS